MITTYTYEPLGNWRTKTVKADKEGASEQTTVRYFDYQEASLSSIKTELASNFVHMCHCLGIDAKCHKWSWPGLVAVGNMLAQRTRSFDPAGGKHGSETYDFSFHQWAESDGKQYDPTSNETHDGTWGSYEDWLYTNYLKCTVVGPPLEAVWDANSPGQSSGCEPTGVHTDNATILLDWLLRPE